MPEVSLLLFNSDTSTAMTTFIKYLLLSFTTLVLTACGGGGDGGEQSTPPNIQPPVAESIWDYTEVAYGTDDPSRQWLNIKLATDQSKPAPVYLFAHANGGTAYSIDDSELNAIAAAGFATISWDSIQKLETADDFDIAVSDAQIMFDWVRANAATYNIDPNQIVIGGRSRGTMVSWQLAHSGHEAIKGIYMFNALPWAAWENPELWNPADDVTANSPITYLVYGPDYDDEDGHNPTFVAPVVAAYDYLDIADRLTMYVDLWATYRDANGNWTNDAQTMHYFGEFVAALNGDRVAPTGSNLFMGHSFFAPIAREMTAHMAYLGQSDYEQHVEMSGGETGTPLALWNDEEHRANIQAVLDTGEVELFAMAVGREIEGYTLWIDYALSKNANTKFVLGFSWVDYPASYTTTEYEATFLEYLTDGIIPQLETLRSQYPSADISIMPYGFSAVELRYMFDAGSLPGITELTGDNAATSIFKDAKGHGHKPGLLLDLSEFIWLNVLFGVDLATYDYSAGHSVDLKEVAQRILEQQAVYFSN